MHGPANSSGSSSAGTVILTSIGAWAASIFVGVPVTIFMLLLLGIPLRLPQLPRSSYASRYPTPTYAPPPVPVRSRPVMPEFRQPQPVAQVPGPPPVNRGASRNSSVVTGPPAAATATSLDKSKGRTPAPSSGGLPPGGSTSFGRLEKGIRVFVEWGGKWYPATVTGNAAYSKIGIHYDGHDAAWDEQVPLERVREMFPNDIRQYGPGDLATAPKPATRNPFAPDTSKFLSQEMHTWTDPSGKEIVKAKLAAASTTGVILINDEGGVNTTVILKMEQLSVADQAYVHAKRGLAGAP